MSIVQKLVVKRRFHNRWKLHIVGTLPKPNTKIVETKVKQISILTHKYMSAHFTQLVTHKYMSAHFTQLVTYKYMSAHFTQLGRGSSHFWLGTDTSIQSMWGRVLLSQFYGSSHLLVKRCSHASVFHIRIKCQLSLIRANRTVLL